MNFNWSVNVLLGFMIIEANTRVLGESKANKIFQRVLNAGSARYFKKIYIFKK